MKIISAQFKKGIVKADPILEDGIPQVAFIGRSNVGKSSIINSLVNQKDLARTSSFPGRTQEINLFLINKSFYLVDLPGYGFAKESKEMQERILQLIYWYLFDSSAQQRKVVLIIDALVGPTTNDLAILRALDDHGKNVVIVANKMDKTKKSEYKKQLQKIKTSVWGHAVIPYSAKNKIGMSDLMKEI